MAEDRGYPLVNLHLGISYLQLGRTLEAREHLLTEWSNKPSDKSGLLELGKALLAAGQGRVAVKCLGSLLKLAPDDARAHQAFGAACLKINSVDEAVVHCGRALELEPGLVEARYGLVLGYYRQGRLWMALKQSWGVLRDTLASGVASRRVLDRLKKD